MSPVIADRRHWLVAAALALAFFAGAVTLLSRGHLHEDAYILYQYSYNLAQGKGIVFDQVSGHAEGATDFLWMATLAALSKTGMTLGTATALLNALGLGIITLVILQIRGRLDLVAAAAIGAAALSGGTAASLGGFSPLAYGAVFSLLLLAALRQRYPLMMALALLLALFRPDGVILAFGTVAVALATAPREQRLRIVAAGAVATVIGGLYFAWRYHYFGLLLPLPLLVKAHTTQPLEGLPLNLAAVERYAYLALPLAYLLYRKQQALVFRRDTLLVAAGPLLLFVMLSFAHQSQNVTYRLQFPLVLGCLYFYLLALADFRPRHRLAPLLLAIVLVPGMVKGGKMLRDQFRYLTNADYINFFPQALRHSGFRADNIALTEAGRFPYWYNAPHMTDLVGLNSAEVVTRGAAATLARQQPELVFVHHDHRYDVKGLYKGQPYLVMKARDLRTVGTAPAGNPVAIAPYAALDYAARHDFTAVLVRYDSLDPAFNHVYFLAPALDLPAFLKALDYSFRTRQSYYDSERQKAATAATPGA